MHETYKKSVRVGPKYGGVEATWLLNVYMAELCWDWTSGNATLKGGADLSSSEC